MPHLNTEVTPTIGLATDPQNKLGQLANKPSTSPLTKNAIQTAAGQSGASLGLATTPDIGAINQVVADAGRGGGEVDPNQLADRVSAAPIAQQQTPSQTGQTNFEGNPLAAIGFLFQSISAGLEGRPPPVNSLYQRRLQERKLRLDQGRAVSQAVIGFLPQLQNKTGEQSARMIDAYAATFSQDGGSAEFGNSVKTALVGMQESLARIGKSPAEAGALGERYQHTLNDLVARGVADPVSALNAQLSTKEGRVTAQTREDAENFATALPTLQTFAEVLNASVGTEVDGMKAFHELLKKNGTVAGQPVITDAELAAFPSMMLQLGGAELVKELTSGELRAINNVGQNDLAQLLGVTYIPSKENQARLASERAGIKKPSDEETDIQTLISDFGLDPKAAFAVANGLLEFQQDPVSKEPVLRSLIPGRSVEDITGSVTDDQAREGKAPPVLAPAAAPTPEPLGRVSIVPPGLDVLEEGTGPLDFLAGVAERVPLLAEFFDGDDERQAQIVLSSLNKSFVKAFSDNPRFPVAEMKIINETLSPATGAFSTVSAARADLIGIRQSLVARIQNETRVAADTTVAPETRKAAQSISINGAQLLQGIDDILTASSPVIDSQAEFDRLPIGASYRRPGSQQVFRKPGNAN